MIASTTARAPHNAQRKQTQPTDKASAPPKVPAAKEQSQASQDMLGKKALMPLTTSQQKATQKLQQNLQRAIGELRKIKASQKLTMGLNPKGTWQLGDLVDAIRGTFKDLTQLGIPSSRLKGLQDSLQALEQLGPNAEVTRVFARIDTVLEELQKHAKDITATGVKSPATTAKTDAANGKETKEKSIWEKIGDFFKGLFKVFSFIMDLVMTVVNKIPGLGNLINAIWQGAKAVVALAQGDMQGALQAAASMLPFVGAEVGKAISLAIKVVKAVVKIVQAIVQAIKTGDPMALMGVLGAVAEGFSGMGGSGLGKAGEMLAKAGKTMTKVLGVASSGIAFVKGAVSGNTDQMLQGLASGLGGLGGMVGGDAGKAMSHIGMGVAGVNHMAHGRVGQGLSLSAGALTPLAGLTQDKGAQRWINTGLAMAKSIGSGDMTGAAGAFVGAMSPLAKGNPAFQQILGLVTPAAGAIQSMSKGNVSGAIQQVTGGLSAIVGNSSLQQAFQWMGALGQTMAGLATSDPKNAMAQLANSPLVKQGQRAIDNGSLNAGINLFRQQLQQLFQGIAGLSKQVTA